MSTTTHDRASRSAAAELDGLLADDLISGLTADLVADMERYLAARGRVTAHPLVTATTEDLVRQALASLPAPPAHGSRPPAGAVLPSGIWKLLPDRLLSLHPGRRGEGVQRLRISVAEHLELTALVLERWGWGQTGRRIRSGTGQRCILGAQAVVFRLGYGTEHTAMEAGRHVQNVLTARGIRTPYPQWNELPTVDGRQALALVRDAATAARR
jgi:hypothetical protein